MNVLEYSDAGIRITERLQERLCSSSAKYVRLTLLGNDRFEYKVIPAGDVGHDDYIIRFDAASNLVITGQVYSKIYNGVIDVIDSLTGTTIVLIK